MLPGNKGSAKLEPGAGRRHRQINTLPSQIRYLKCGCTKCSQWTNTTTEWLKLHACRMALGWTKTSNSADSCTYPPTLNLAASIPSLCIWGCSAPICIKPQMGIVSSFPNPVSVCFGKKTGLPWGTVGNWTNGQQLQTALGTSFH